MGMFTGKQYPTTAPTTPARRALPQRNNGMRVHSLTAAMQSKQQRRQADKISQVTTGWQDDAWRYYDTVGELRYVVQYLTNALSRCTLIPSGVDEFGVPTEQCDNPLVQQIVADIAGGPAGQSQLLGTMATHLTVPGECWLAIIVKTDTQGERREEWHILSGHEVKQKRGGDITITLPDGTNWILDPQVDSIHRVWQPHARVASQADSAVRANLPTLREITRLSQYIEATAKSRLVSNGILAVPNEMSLPAFNAPTGSTAWQDPAAPGLPPLDDTTIEPDYAAGELPAPGSDLLADFAPKQAGAEALTDALLETFETAVADPSSAAALAPIIIEAPGDMIGQIQHIKLGTEFTDTVLKLRESAIRRLSLGLNVPAEILTGMGGSNHWSAWQIEESAIKMHVEPLLTTIVDRLTEHVLRPLLAEAGLDPNAFTIWYDTSALTLKPNRAEDAQVAFNAGLITGEAFRTELGFTEEQAPAAQLSELELRDLAIRLVLQSPNLLGQLADTIGFKLDTQTAEAPPVAAQPTGGPGAQPDDDDDADDRSMPDREDD